LKLRHTKKYFGLLLNRISFAKWLPDGSEKPGEGFVSGFRAGLVTNSRNRSLIVLQKLTAQSEFQNNHKSEIVNTNDPF
jgi:hypothetical protein